MRGRFITWLVFSMVILFPAAALSLQNETDGFMGLKWGADFSTFEGMVPIKKTPKGGNIYKKEGDKVKFGSVTITDMLYSFSSEGKLEGVMVNIKGQKEFLALKTECINRYGAVEDSEEDINEKYVWTGETTSVYLTYNMKTKSGFFYAGPAAKKSVEEEEY